MPFTQRTELGRKVLLEDWKGFHRDRLLAQIYTMRDSGELGLTIAQISSIAGLDHGQCYVLCRWMSDHKPKLVEWDGEGKVYITKRGVRWVEESPQQP